MTRRLWIVSTLVTILFFSAGFALAVEQNRVQDRALTQTQEQVYGSQLMTQQERSDYQARMGAANTAAEREQIREKHHEAMIERARERGVTMPEDTPATRGNVMRGDGSGNMDTGTGRMMERGDGMMERSNGTMGSGGGKMRSGGGRGR